MTPKNNSKKTCLEAVIPKFNRITNNKKRESNFFPFAKTYTIKIGSKLSPACCKYPMNGKLEYYLSSTLKP